LEYDPALGEKSKWQPGLSISINREDISFILPFWRFRFDAAFEI